MDPVTNLRRQLELAAQIIALIDSATTDDGQLPDAVAQQVADLANELAELVAALDEWRTKGGFDPYLPDVGDKLPTHPQGLALARFLHSRLARDVGARVTLGGAGLPERYLHVAFTDGFEGGIDDTGRVST
jgi:hypothetical protein